MKNIIEKLLKIDAGKLEIETKECKVDKLSEILKEDVKFACYPVSLDVYNEIQKNSVEFDKKGNLTGVNTGEMNIQLVLEGVPDIKDKTLLEHFGKITPKELLKDKKLFKVGDVTKLAKTISELSGITEVEKADKEIKNS
ncbi:phage tail assembly chaperone [Clostridium sp.]|uniref:phage tail assembly chaperone n=1 Tax=Clostridium sp. TaxID=1506 RepID=UPI0028489C8E|nr:XkdN-like protein [Clostridium sp.]MDR3595101.1 XkdN-like protein [Clostridium sp.]